jgi:ADP-glucose pyrophosphorylase
MLGSMGIYIFRVEILLEALQEMEWILANKVIPGMISGHRDIFIYDFEERNNIRDFESQGGVRYQRKDIS